ncbi:hypothetical protein G4V62_10970 [Bacillaceae bacterium SIJ1]|uniref:hypothetical protein n=1 Tax=Litoribacterium kuwaitense TaxID=1398745 RepID=UPI0013ED1CAD|nr:hypothetical protein [Litoribacterium kuwaitense]NGP45454.1 hypothetical protein [Litoribacterium kuwaitense]
MKQISWRLGALFTILAVLSGCASEDTNPKVEVQFHEMIPDETVVRIDDYIENTVSLGIEANETEEGKKDEVDILAFPFIAQKITVEIGAARTVDILIANEDYMVNILNQGGLVSLDDLYEGEEPPEEWKPYVREDPESGESHLFAVPLTEDTRMFNELELRPTRPLLALIPIFSNVPEEAKEVLKVMAEPVESE